MHILSFILLLFQQSWLVQPASDVADKGQGLYTWKYEVRDNYNKRLVISGEDVSIFVNNKLVSQSDNDTLELGMLGSGTIYLSFIGQGAIDFKLMTPTEVVPEPGARNARVSKDLRGFLSVYLTIMLVFLAYIKWTRDRDLSDYLRVDRMFSPRNPDENILRVKLYSSTNLIFSIFLAMLVSGITITYLQLKDPVVRDLWGYMSEWLWWLMIISVIIGIKWLVVQVFTFIFNFGAFLHIHMVNFLRISSFFSMIWMAVLLFISWGNYGSVNVAWVFKGIVISMLLMLSILFLKLINAEGYRRFHLFSYLCATEIIPVLTVISIFAVQN